MSCLSRDALAARHQRPDLCTDLLYNSPKRRCVTRAIQAGGLICVPRRRYTQPKYPSPPEQNVAMTRKTRWIYIPVEVQAREFDSKTLLAATAAEHGYSVMLAEQATLFNRLPDLPAGLIYDKSLAINRTEQIVGLHRIGHRFVCNDEESLAIYNPHETQQYCDTRLTNVTLGCSEKVLCWGVLQQEILKNAFPNSAEKFVVTGTQRTDIWQQPANSVFTEQARRCRDTYGKYILLPSNFSGVIHARGRNYKLTQAHEYGLIQNQEEEAAVQAIVDRTNYVLDQYLDTIPLILAEFPDHKLLIRPHPGDDITFWHELAARHDRVVVENTGPATPWLLGADCIFHAACTTAFEAYVMGGRPVTFLPGDDPDLLTNFQVRTGPVVRDQSALMAAMHAVIDNQPFSVPGADTAYLNDRVLLEDGVLASDRILQTLSDIELPTVRPRRTVRDAASAARNELKWMFRTDADRDATRVQGNRTKKWAGTSARQINRKIRGLGQALGRFDRVKVRPFARNMFEISAR